MDGDPESFAYDKLGRIVSRTDALGTTAYAWLGQTGQQTSQIDGLAATRFAYATNANDRRLTAIANSPAASGFNYATTPENDISSITETRSPQTWAYTYDPADRVTAAVSSAGPAYSYGYDAASNVTAVATPSGSAAVAPTATNAVASADGTPFVYDANGNLLRDGSRTYQWDAENRLVGISYLAVPGDATAFRYDGLNRRVAIVTTSGGVTGEVDYGWCGEALCQARTAAGVAIRRYFPEGERDLADGLSLYYGRDHLGSVRDVIALPSGTTSNRFDYDPYGNVRTATGSPVSATDFRYAGLFWHGQSGLYLATYRAYDPGVGRWVSRDPIGERGGINLYGYVGGNPVGRVDPQGTSWRANIICGFGDVISCAQAKAAEQKACPQDSNWPPNSVANEPPSDDTGNPDLIGDRAGHILDGDGTGGGHRSGTGKPGKSEFPGGWSDKEILDKISDVATDPNSTRVIQPNGNTAATGTRDGVEIKAIVNPQGKIVTGFPTNTPRNPR